MSDHEYVSTACHHGQHDACRLTCKFCSAPCRCGCHCAEEGTVDRWKAEVEALSLPELIASFGPITGHRAASPAEGGCDVVCGECGEQWPCAEAGQRQEAEHG